MRTFKKRIVFLAGMFLILGYGFYPASRSFGVAGTGGYDSPYFQADFIQELSDWTSSLINPALLYRVNQMHLSFGAYRWSVENAGPLGFQNMAFFYPVRRNQTVGFTILGTGASINKTEIDPQSLSIQDKGTENFADIWVIGNYAVRLPTLPWLVLGTNLKYRFLKRFDEGYTTNSPAYPGVDIGVYINPIDHYYWGDVGLSLNFEDVIPAKINWQSNTDQTTVTRIRAGIRYAAFNDQIICDFETVIDNALVDMVKGLGLLDSVDYSYFDNTTNQTKLLDLKKALRFSGHFRYQFIPQVWFKFGWNNNNIPYLGFNFNVIFPLPEMINYFNVDCNVGYSFLEYLDNKGPGGDERGITLMGKASFDLGPTREQRESKRLYDLLLIAPMDAYQEAMRLYYAGKYWEAAFAFGKVISLFPNFHLNDKATWYLGDCYRRLDMNSIAREVFKEALDEYTTSDMRARYLYGLEDIDYREGKYEDALKNHAFIINLYAESDVRPEADYIAGQIHFERKNYNVAEQLFKNIKPKDVTYLYAQYTLSIINVESNRTQAAIENLKHVVSDTTQDPAELSLQDAANLKLGHLYYEQGNQLRQAVESYQRVPETSPYADEAFLATSWAWIKVNKPEICLQSIDRLMFAHPQSPLIPESYLVKGYSLMLQKRYAESVTALEKCIELCKGTYVTSADLAQKKQQFDVRTQDFIPEMQKIKKNTFRKPTNRTIDERSDMRGEYDKFGKDVKDFYVYSLLAKSHSRFFKRKDQLVEDAEYALAKATNMMKSRKQTEINQDQKEKTGKIDNEIDKLKQELQKIEKK